MRGWRYKGWPSVRPLEHQCSPFMANASILLFQIQRNTTPHEYSVPYEHPAGRPNYTLHPPKVKSSSAPMGQPDNRQYADPATSQKQHKFSQFPVPHLSEPQKQKMYQQPQNTTDTVVKKQVEDNKTGIPSQVSTPSNTSTEAPPNVIEKDVTVSQKRESINSGARPRVKSSISADAMADGDTRGDQCNRHSTLSSSQATSKAEGERVLIKGLIIIYCCLTKTRGEM